MRRPRAALTIRKDILAVGTLLLLVSLLVYYTPVRTTFYADYTSFSPSAKQGWYDFGLLYIPGGDGLSAKLLSDSPIIFGIVTRQSWDAFISSTSPAPVFTSSVRGTNGSVSIAPGSGTALYLVAGIPAGSTLPVFKVIVVTTGQHVLVYYAMMAAIPGAVLIMLSITYERFKYTWLAAVRRHR